MTRTGHLGRLGAIHADHRMHAFVYSYYTNPRYPKGPHLCPTRTGAPGGAEERVRAAAWVSELASTSTQGQQGTNICLAPRSPAIWPSPPEFASAVQSRALQSQCKHACTRTLKISSMSLQAQIAHACKHRGERQHGHPTPRARTPHAHRLLHDHRKQTQAKPQACRPRHAPLPTSP